MTTIRVRSKTNTAVDDPATSTDPGFVRVTIGGTTAAGPYLVQLVPEDTTLETLEFEFVRVAENDTAIASALASAANTFAASAPGRNFLRPVSSSAAAVLALAIEPNAPVYSLVFVPPGSATMTPDVTGALPMVAASTGEDALSITPVAVTSGSVPLAPGSGVISMDLVSIIDRTQPRGPKGHTMDGALAATSVAASVSAHPLSTPWIVDAPPMGRYWVRMHTDANLPGSTATLEVWSGPVTAPVPAPTVEVTVP